MKNQKVVLFSIPILLTIVLVLLLLTYVGFGEARRVYPKFQIRKLATQAEIIQISLRSFLQAGLPLSQYSGFGSQSENLLKSDPGIESIRITNMEGENIFSQFQPQASPSQIAQRQYYPTKIAYDKVIKHLVQESDESFRVTLTLTGKFGEVGQVVIESSKEAVFKSLNEGYRYVFLTFIGLSVLFIIIIVSYELFNKQKTMTRQILKYSYIVGFIIMSAAIAVSVYHIYGEGARANTKALSDSMGQRLSQIIELGIDIKDISGIDQTFQSYKANNENINAIALIENGVCVVHTNAQLIGQQYKPIPDSYEYVTPLDLKEKAVSEFRVAVSIPYKVVLMAILGSARNFIVLFIACGIISLLFLEVSTYLLINRSDNQVQKEDKAKAFESGMGLVLVKPAYFLIVFVSALSVSFLPQLVLQLMPKESSIATVSLPFSIYYFIFAAALVPAGQYAEKGSLKLLMGLGFLAEVIGLAMIAFTDQYWILTGGRVFSGIGQGAFLIGLQSYLIVIAPADKRTEAAAIKVNGRNSALIAGSAIGALLYSYMDYTTLFMISSIVSIIGFVYLIALVPREEALFPAKPKDSAKKAKQAKTKARSSKNLFAVLKDGEFMKSLLLVGFPGKMSITGVIMFSIPLIMRRLGFPYDDIGQAMMIYYISSMIMTYYASKIVDRFNNSRSVLFQSSLIGGVGMLLLGFVGVTHIADSQIPGVSQLSLLAEKLNIMIGFGQTPYLTGVIIVSCLVVIGISNGLMAAPIITHITHTKVAQALGEKSVSATYTFLERVAHVLGPMVIYRLLVLTGDSNIAISVFGIVTIALGLLFIVTSRGEKLGSNLELDNYIEKTQLK